MPKPKLPKLVLTPIPAGFPNPAADAADLPLDLNKLLIEHPAATFYMRVKGSSMEGAGIYDGDLVVVDKALEPRHGDIIVAKLDDEFTLKRFLRSGRRVQLAAENPDYPPITIGEGHDFEVWGVVRAAIRRLR
jgi:DNA polymerase V